MRPRSMVKVIDRKRYNTDTATEIASNAHWDGSNWERSGRNTFLFRTPNGAYFRLDQTCWQGEQDSIRPLSVDEAVVLYEALTVVEMDFEEAFPGIEVSEA